MIVDALRTKPDTELRDYWTQQRRKQEQLSDNTETIVPVPKKNLSLLKKKTSESNTVLNAKAATKKANITKIASKPAANVILLSDDDDDNNKRKHTRDSEILSTRERELKRREDVLLSKESDFISRKQKVENETKESKQSVMSIFLQTNASHSNSILNSNGFNVAPQLQNLPVMPCASFAASREGQLMIMLYAHEIERTNQRFQELDRKRSNELLLQSLAFIANKK